MTSCPRRARVHRAVVVVAAVLLLLSACGRRGAPLPPLPVVPAAVSGLRAEPREAGILLSWTRPTRNSDASALTDLREFRLSRATVALGTPSVPASAFSLVATVRADRPENASVQGPLYVFRDDAGGQGLATDRQYRYRIQAVNARGEGGAVSSDVTVDFTAAPAPPTGVKASAGDGTVDLEWQAPTGVSPAAAPPKGYNVYRGLQSGVYGLQPVHAAPVRERRFRDAGVQNDVAYYYVVRSVSNDRPPWRESADSQEVSVVPEDFIPPSPPRGLVALPGEGIVALTWDANPDPDLLGYSVYRREAHESVAVRLTEAPVPGTTFTDRTPRRGAMYVYTVTAVDRSARRNESAPSTEAEINLP
jgi:uncharacterized protein